LHKFNTYAAVYSDANVLKIRAHTTKTPFDEKVICMKNAKRHIQSGISDTKTKSGSPCKMNFIYYLHKTRL